MCVCLCVCVCVCVCVSKSTMYVKSGHKTKVHVMRNTSKLHYIPQKHSKLLSPYLVCPMLALPLALILLSFTKLLPFFVTNDKGCIIERSSSHHHTLS